MRLPSFRQIADRAAQNLRDTADAVGLDSGRVADLTQAGIARGRENLQRTGEALHGLMGQEAPVSEDEGGLANASGATRAADAVSSLAQSASERTSAAFSAVRDRVRPGEDRA